MTPRTHIKGGLVLLGGSLATAFCSFIRNIVIARLISVEDFGIASTFAMVMSLAEMTSNLALDRLLVQASDGDEPRLQAVAHAFQFVRGLIASLVLFSIAGPVAAFFGISEVAWAFRVLALAPITRALAHLDMARLQRTMNFVPSVFADTGAQVLATLAAVPLALWLRDYSVMLWVVLGQALFYTAISHVVAHRSYMWAWDAALVGRMLSFGWPLLFNGVLMFGIFHGDRAIVGGLISMEALGWYSAAFALMMIPTLVLSRVLQSLMLPFLASAQDDRRLYNRRFCMVGHVCVATGAAFALGAMICGDDLLVLLYGAPYAPAAAVVPWLAAMQGVRIARLAQSVGAIGRGDTRNPLCANIVRSLALVLAVAAARRGLGPVGIAASGVVGEVLAALWSQRLLHLRLSLPYRPLLGPVAISSILLSGAALTLAAFERQRPILYCDIGAAPVAAAIVFVIMILSSGHLRTMLRREWRTLWASPVTVAASPLATQES